MWWRSKHEDKIPEGYVSHRELRDILKTRKIDSFDTSVRTIGTLVTVGLILLTGILGYFSFTALDKIEQAREDIREIKEDVPLQIMTSLRSASSEIDEDATNTLAAIRREQDVLRTNIMDARETLIRDVTERMKRIESDYREYTGRPLAQPKLVLLHKGQPVQDGGSYGGILSNGFQLGFHEFSLKNVGDAPATIHSVSYYFRDQMKPPPNTIIFDGPEKQESTDAQYPCLFVSTVGRVQTIAADANIEYFLPIWIREDEKSIDPPVHVRIVVYYNGETLSRSFMLTHVLLPKGK